MKNLKLLTLISLSLFTFSNRLGAQLPNGSYGKNFTMQDYLGVTYSLYDYTDAGKPVIVDFSAIWCGPCWSYHQSGALEDYYNAYGPSGNNSSMVFWIEADENPLACLLGNTTQCPSTKGNWTAGTSFPMFLTVPPNDTQVVNDYQIGYFPTIYLVCPNRKVTEVGQEDAAGLHTAALGCPPPGVHSLDAATWSAKTPTILCTGSINPEFSLQNYGSTTLTSCNVIVKLDGSPVDTAQWTGSLAKYEISEVTIPSITVDTEGAHTLFFEIINPNGGTDENTSNNTIEVNFSIPSIGGLPVIEGFESVTFPPTYWLIDNPDNGLTWKRTTSAGGFGNSNSSTILEFYDINEGNIDDLYLPPIDLSNAPSASLTFNVAYARYSASYYDNLKVQVSTNCGTTWLTVYIKSGSALATAPDHTTSFTPTASEWRTDTVNLNNYIGQSKVFVRFRGTSGWGNNLYIDDINLSATTSITENEPLFYFVGIYPNPFTNQMNIEFSLKQPQEIQLNVYDNLGKLVYSENSKYSSGKHNLTLNAEMWRSGLYFVSLIAGDEIFSKKVVLNR